MESRFRRFSIDAISYWLAQVGSIVVLSAMMCLTTLDVILRDFFNNPIYGANDMNCLMMMMLVFFSISYCWVERGHIRMELLVRLLPPWGKNLCWTLAAAAGVCVFGFMSYQSFVAISRSITFHELTFESQIVLWPFRIIFSGGCCIFTFQLLTDFFRYLAKVFKGAAAS
jgi:TRAP-type C4-dicarboxylate transport system permease small subunit